MIAVAILLFLVIPIISIPILIFGLIFDSKNQKIYALMLSISVGLLVYQLLPDTSLDLYRYYQIMDVYKEYSIVEFLEQFLQGSEPLAKFYIYLISKTGRFNLLPMITSIISYNIIFYIFFDYIKDKKISVLERLLLILFILSTFIVVYLIGIRFVLARLVFFLALYLDLYKRKKALPIFLYFISLLLHSGIIICIICRLFLLFTRGCLRIKEIILIFFLAFSSSFVLSFFGILSNIPILSTLSQQLVNYSATGYADGQILYILQFFSMIVIGLFIIYLYLHKDTKDKSENIFINFNLLILIFSIINYRIPTYIARLLLILLSSVPILFIYYINKKRKENNTIKKNRFVFLYLILMALIVPFMGYQIISLQTAGSYNSILINIITLLFE